jgi:hypothetical protein
MLLVVGGLSGAGKSELGRHLERYHAFRWVELDCYPKDMVDELAIRSEWDDFLAGNPWRLIERFAGDVVLTGVLANLKAPVSPPGLLLCGSVRNAPFVAFSDAPRFPAPAEAITKFLS